eukprot:jgi/Chrzof1/11339/Cz05g32300.t1
MFALAKRNNITLPYPSQKAAIAARAHYSDLKSFLFEYNLGMMVLRTEEDFHELATAYLAKAALQNISHVEIFFDAQSHLRRGVPFDAIINGLHSAIVKAGQHLKHPITATLILCFVRDLSEFDAIKTLLQAVPYLRHISGVGLASAEVGNPPRKFQALFATAAGLGLHRVAHAGEEGGADYVWETIKHLHAERIDHGIHALDDPALVRYMADMQLPITLCPISNLKLQVYEGQLEQRLISMLSSGILVTINSDDPAYFGSYLNANYAYVAAVANLTADGLIRLAKNGFQASFISDDQKQQYYDAVDEAADQWRHDWQLSKQAV